MTGRAGLRGRGYVPAAGLSLGATHDPDFDPVKPSVVVSLLDHVQVLPAASRARVARRSAAGVRLREEIMAWLEATACAVGMRLPPPLSGVGNAPRGEPGAARGGMQWVWVRWLYALPRAPEDHR
jgi:hypothetical protein